MSTQPKYDVTESKYDVAVIVDDLQTVLPKVEAYQRIIESFSRILVVLPVNRCGLSTFEPLDYAARSAMFLAEFPSADYPNVTVVPLRDVREASDWVAALDARIREVFPHGKVVVMQTDITWRHNYVRGGGRYPTSPLFMQHSGKKEPSSFAEIVATRLKDLRQFAQQVVASVDFRKGMAYAASQVFPSGKPTADIAIIDWDRKRILLGRKKGEALFRFPGGYFDVVKDNSYESTAIREAFEETDISIDPLNLHYVKSMMVDDWRMVTSQDKICTVLFMGDYVSGHAKAKDDIVEVGWYALEKEKDPTVPAWPFFSQEVLMPEHRPLYNLLMVEVIARLKPQTKVIRIEEPEPDEHAN